MEKDIKKIYNNRELSWIDFNHRVLDEAFKKDYPIMERIKFLGITASNLDEFFMVRVAGLMEQVESGFKKKDSSGLTPKQQLLKLKTSIKRFLEDQYSCWHKSVKIILKNEKIHFLKPQELNKEQKKFIAEYFDKIVFPSLTPLAVDKSRPFPLLGNKTLNIVIKLSVKGEQTFAVIQVPSILPRFVQLPSKEFKEFILLEDIIIDHLCGFFESHEIKASAPFRVTRNADLEIDEEAEDLMIEIQKSIKKRKRGKPVRLEILKNCDIKIKKFLIEMLDVEKIDIYELPGPIDFTFLNKFVALKCFEQLKLSEIEPVNPPADFFGEDDIFEAIKQRDRMLHLPYESFDPILNFIKAAAKDKNVLAIKQTLYRVSGDSPIIKELIHAAENGKQVTVLVELKARFDEENNINWAKKLEEAGCHVIYGLCGLKTHCKVLLIVRKEEDNIKRYIHLSTGNYNDVTAKFYTDIGLFTCDPNFGADISLLFNSLTGYTKSRKYEKLVSAPTHMREFFKNMINEEIKNAKKGLPSGITMKINALVDPILIKSLYEASCAGVKIELIVRGICCLIPGIHDVSENINVRSIVGRFLEHSRIFKFESAGNTKIFIGSADLMQRNLDRRVEIVFPIEDETIKTKIINILELLIKDNKNAKIQTNDALYIKANKNHHKAIDAQNEFINLAKLDLKNKEELIENNT